MSSDALPVQRRRHRCNDDCIVVYLDVTNTEAHISLLSQCGCSIESFTDPTRCTDFITDLTDQQVFCILVGELDEDVVSILNDSSVVHAIYIVGLSDAEPQSWTSNYSKVNGVFSDLLPIIEAIKRVVQLFYRNSTPITIVSPVSSSQRPNTLNAMFMYCQLLKETFLEMNHGEQAKRALVELCRREHANNQATLRVIDEFDRDYARHSPTWWYTRDCFVYRMLNEALRTHDIEVINRFGFFIKDLYRQLEELHRNLPSERFTVYRGQGMSNEDFEKKLKGNVGGLLSFNNFLSTSVDERVSRHFALPSLDDPKSKAILFVIHVNLALASSPVGFLDAGFSYFYGENEYLWGMNTIFRIEEIREGANGLCQVNLTMTRNDDSQLNELADFMRREASVFSGLQRLGHLMMDMAEWSKAKDIYETFLQEHDDPCVIQQLGFIAHQMNDLGVALERYQQALSLFTTSRSPNDPELATIYSNIGCVLNDQGRLNEALKQFERTLELQRSVRKPNDLQIARTYNNIATVRDKQGRAQEALENMELALNILRKCLPSTHPEIAAALGNIGTFYYKKEQYSNAKRYYEECLSIQELSLPSHHPDRIHTTDLMKETSQRIGDHNKGRRQFFSGQGDRRPRFLALALLCLFTVTTPLFIYFIWKQSNSGTSNILCGTDWTRKGLRIAGGVRSGNALNRLNSPRGLYVDDNQTVLVADSYNNRIVEWQLNATNGRVVAGGKERGNRTDQLYGPSAVILDHETQTLIICDRLNSRVMRWPRHNGANGTIIIENIACVGLAMDSEGSLYVTDQEKHAVRRYPKRKTNDTIVAGGNGRGADRNQLHNPNYVFVDRDRSVYVSDGWNHRVMKWVVGAKVGVIVAGGQGQGNNLTQLSSPQGVLVDAVGTVYVADYSNNRVMRWCRKAKQGTVSVGGISYGKRTHQLHHPMGLALDRHGHLYVSEHSNHRIQRFSVRTN